MRETVDVMDEKILLTLREGPQGPKALSELASVNYNILRQRIGKLSRYGYVSKPDYGEYALTGKGRQLVDDLSTPVSTDFDDPGLKKLINMLPSGLHRAFFLLAICGVIAKYLLFQLYDDGYPGFILGGRTRGFKTALGNVLCRVFGLRPEKNIYPMYLATPGEFGVRRLRSKAARGFDISESSYFNESFMVFDEFDKVGDKNIRRNVLFFLDGRAQFDVEGKSIQNHACTMVTLNTNLRKEGLERFGIPEPYIRRCVVADTEYVETELQNVDLVAKEIFELKAFPRISLKRLQINRTKLSDAEFNSLRDLLMACTQDEFKRLVDTRPLEILTLGRSALLGGDVRESIYQTLWDRLICLESLGGTVAGWREVVNKEWSSYKRQEQPELKKQLVEAESRDQARKLTLEERKGKIQQRTADQIGAKYELIYQRQLLVKDIRAYIPRFQYNHPELAKTLAALWREVAAKAVTDEALKAYRLSFSNILNQKVFPILEEEKRRQSLEAEKREQLSKINPVVEKVNALNKRYKEFGITNTEIENWLAEIREYQRKVEAGQELTLEDYLLPDMISLDMWHVEATLVEIKQRKEEEAKSAKENERQAAIRKKEQEQIERKRKIDKAGELRACLKPINHYLGRKYLREGEDPVLILQQLQIVQPVEGSMFLKVSDKPVKGYWLRDRWSGQLKYRPPFHAFIDYGANVLRGSEVSNGRIYKWSEEVQFWTSWVAVWPLLQAKRAQYLRQIALLTVSNNVERR
ncbi:hypothetical protein ACFLYL_02740 [Chloroflexota bacterium]